MIKELNDSLDNLFEGDITSDGAPKVQPPAHYQELVEAGHFEKCGKCRGSGQTRWGQCFSCQGKGGKTFKTAPEAKARNAAADRKARIEQASVEAFRAAHQAEYEWLVATAPRWELAASLLAGLHRFGSLTEKQMGIVTGGIARDAARAAERQARDASAPVADGAGVDRLKAAFDTAIAKAQAKGRGRSLKMPRITIGGVVISPARATSKNPGALYVKERGSYLGKITGGRFFAATECTGEQSARVLAFIADPKAAAEAYGKETGLCCICNATLTNKESIERGIGPICATNMGW